MARDALVRAGHVDLARGWEGLALRRMVCEESCRGSWRRSPLGLGCSGDRPSKHAPGPQRCGRTRRTENGGVCRPCGLLLFFAGLARSIHGFGVSTSQRRPWQVRAPLSRRAYKSGAACCGALDNAPHFALGCKSQTNKRDKGVKKLVWPAALVARVYGHSRWMLSESRGCGGSRRTSRRSLSRKRRLHDFSWDTEVTCGPSTPRRSGSWTASGPICATTSSPQRHRSPAQARDPHRHRSREPAALGLPWMSPRSRSNKPRALNCRAARVDRDGRDHLRLAAHHQDPADRQDDNPERGDFPR